MYTIQQAAIDNARFHDPVDGDKRLAWVPFQAWHSTTPTASTFNPTLVDVDKLLSDKDVALTVAERVREYMPKAMFNMTRACEKVNPTTGASFHSPELGIAKHHLNRKLPRLKPIRTSAPKREVECEDAPATWDKPYELTVWNAGHCVAWYEADTVNECMRIAVRWKGSYKARIQHQRRGRRNGEATWINLLTGRKVSA